MYLPTKGEKKLKKKSAKDLHVFDDVYAIFFWFSLKKHFVDTHLNCTDKCMQFKWVPTTHAFIKK